MNLTDDYLFVNSKSIQSMICSAIWNMNDYEGSSLHSIVKFVIANHRSTREEDIKSTVINLVKAKCLIQTNNGKFKCSAKCRNRCFQNCTCLEPEESKICKNSKLSNYDKIQDNPINPENSENPVNPENSEIKGTKKYYKKKVIKKRKKARLVMKAKKKKNCCVIQKTITSSKIKPEERINERKAKRFYKKPVHNKVIKVKKNKKEKPSKHSKHLINNETKKLTRKKAIKKLRKMQEKAKKQCKKNETIIKKVKVLEKTLNKSIKKSIKKQKYRKVKSGKKLR